MTMSLSKEKPFNNFYTPENSQFYTANVYQPLNPDADEFRILEILPGNSDDIIRCNIVQPFCLNISYEALSYRAGDPMDIREIFVNNHSFNAFATLFAAIKRLRHPDKSRLIWIDQICINQSDVMERNSQVQKMRNVYEKAEQVIAWLGPLTGGEIAFNAVCGFYENFQSRLNEYRLSLLPGQQFLWRHVEDVMRSVREEYLEEFELADQTDDNEYLTKAKALGQFFQSDFWARVWIWQEITVAKSVQIFWDTKSMDSAVLFTVASIISKMVSTGLITERPLSLSYLCPSPARRSGLHLMCTVADLRECWEPQSPLNIKFLLRKCRNAQSSDLRDRVYAIAGLIRKDYQIRPEYTSTPTSVYCRTAWSVISQDHSLDLLAFCMHPVRGSSLVLPSWCPDWSTSSRRSRKALIREDVIDSKRESRFRASKNLVASCHMEIMADVDLGIQSFALSVEGLRVDKVEDTTISLLRHGSSDKRYQHLLESCAQLLGKKKIITDELREEIDRTVTVANCGGGPDDSDPQKLRRDKQERKMDAILGRRRFFTSETGLMGMAPPHVQPADSICVLFGAKVPFLLRKVGDFYKLIGEVYVSDGYMEGRACDEMEAGTRKAEWFEIH